MFAHPLKDNMEYAMRSRSKILLGSLGNSCPLGISKGIVILLAVHYGVFVYKIQRQSPIAHRMVCIAMDVEKLCIHALDGLYDCNMKDYAPSCSKD